MKYNSNFKYDLEVGVVKEKELGKILSEKKIEIKYDLKALKTGNVYVEYESRGKPSGIATTEAEFYCFAIGDTYHLIPTDRLKEKCRKILKETPNRNALGGDSNTSKGILLPIKDLF